MNGAFPRNNATDEKARERYTQWALTFFKPWRRPSDLKDLDQTWEKALEAWKPTMPAWVGERLGFLQIFHDGNDLAKRVQENGADYWETSAPISNKELSDAMDKLAAEEGNALGLNELAALAALSIKPIKCAAVDLAAACGRFVAGHPPQGDPPTWQAQRGNALHKPHQTTKMPDDNKGSDDKDQEYPDGHGDQLVSAMAYRVRSHGAQLGDTLVSVPVAVGATTPEAMVNGLDAQPALQRWCRELLTRHRNPLASPVPLKMGRDLQTNNVDDPLAGHQHGSCTGPPCQQVQ
jgi:hypothetical protein